MQTTQPYQNICGNSKTQIRRRLKKNLNIGIYENISLYHAGYFSYIKSIAKYKLLLRRNNIFMNWNRIKNAKMNVANTNGRSKTK